MSKETIEKNAPEPACVTVTECADGSGVNVSFGTDDFAKALAMISAAVAGLAENVGIPMSGLLEIMLGAARECEEEEEIGDDQ